MKKDTSQTYEKAAPARHHISGELAADGSVEATPPGLRICLAHSGPEGELATFIRPHLERLKAREFSTYLPSHLSHNERTESPSFLPLLRRLGYGMGRRFLGMDSKGFIRFLLANFLRRHRIQAVLAECGPTAAAILEPCRKARIPLITHFHGADAYQTDGPPWYKNLFPRLLESSAALIAVSRHMEKHLFDLGAPPEKLFYNCCGVDTETFKGSDPEAAPPRFVSVGRLIEKKGPHLTLLAFKKVIEKMPEATLVMVSTGHLLEYCRRMAEALGIAHAVHFTGYRPYVEIPKILRQGRAFVLHSMEGGPEEIMEGTPVAILEAGASGLPAVSTKHGGIPDVITDGENGFLVEEGDIEGMAERMLRFAKDPVLAARMGARARQKVVQEFSMEKSIANLKRIIAFAWVSPKVTVTKGDTHHP